MYTLYTIPGTCSTGIAILMKKLDINFTSIAREATPNYATLVPTNQVPAIKLENGKILTEGAAIAIYLLEKHGKNMIPSDIDERAEFYQWLNFNYSTLHPAYGSIFAIAWSKELADTQKVELMQSLANNISDKWKILDKRLDKQKYILGDTPCHVDYMAAIYSSWNNNLPDIEIKLGDNVKRFIKDVSALPEFKAGYIADNATFKLAG